MDNTVMIIIAVVILLLVIGVIGFMMSKKTDKVEEKKETPSTIATPPAITPPVVTPPAVTPPVVTPPTRDLTVFTNVLSNSPNLVNLSDVKNIGIIDGHVIEMGTEPYVVRDFSFKANGIPCNSYNNEFICSGSSKPIQAMMFASTPRNAKDLSLIGKLGGNNTCVNDGQKITCNGALMKEFPTKKSELYRMVLDCNASGCTNEDNKFRLQSGSSGKFCVLNNDKTVSCNADSLSQGQVFELFRNHRSESMKETGGSVGPVNPVILYSEPNFGGSSITMGSTGEFKQNPVNWDVKSFRVAPGFKIIHWSEPDFKPVGVINEWTIDVPNLDIYKMKIGSFKIEKV